IEMFVQNKIKEDGFWDKFFGIFRADNWKYAVIYFLMIIFFAYFYAAIQYNPVEMANNIRKNGGAILGIRPGKPTSDYIGGIIGKIIIIGALLLSVVALFPIIFSIITEAALGEGNGMNITLGGTSIIIMVGVALETVKQLESQMMMRHYKGFLD
ncbi:MAG TPA: SecY family transport protein, partial [Clostridiales bacterium]|nr:SecY family transport protein [Clostridiales bacterium]